MCIGGKFRNPSDNALDADGRLTHPGRNAINADGIHVGSDVVFGSEFDAGQLVSGSEFEADGEVRLLGGHIGGQLICSGGKFRNPMRDAISADGLEISQLVSFDRGFVAEGAVRLIGARINAQFVCSGGKFRNQGGIALGADSLQVTRSMFCDDEFEAQGEVRLLGANIGGSLYCSGGKFLNHGGIALGADRVTVGSSMVCGMDFEPDGEVRLPLAMIGGHLDFANAKVSRNGVVLRLNRAVVTGNLVLRPAMGNALAEVDLSQARVATYLDSAATWPQKLMLVGFVYESIEPLILESPHWWDLKSWIRWGAISERLQWLKLNGPKFSPQIYDQLAATYRQSGREEEARRVAIAKQEMRRAQLNLAGKVWNSVLHWTVGYGYRTWQALGWLLGLLALGTFVFSEYYPSQLVAAKTGAEQPEFQPIIFTLDVLVPVINLHQRDAWVAHGAAQWWVLGFTLAGWVLTSAVVLALSGLLKRD